MTHDPQAYQRRVLTEREDLAYMLRRLDSFIESPQFASVDPDEQKLLRKQGTAMSHYLHVLDARIALWSKKP